MSKKGISMKTAFSRLARAVGIWRKYDPQQLNALLLSRLFTKLTPYATVFLSARIINALVTGVEAREVWRLIGITLGVTTLFAVISAILNRWYEARKDGNWITTSKVIADKHAAMDFVDADSQHVADLTAQIQQNDNWGGRGLSRIPRLLEELLDGAFSMLGGIVLSVELFILPIPSGSLRFLNNPLFAICILAVMLTVALASGQLVGVANAAWEKYASDARLGNRMFGAYGFFATRLKRAVDIRIYRQERISRFYMGKGDVFTENSPLATEYRGKLGLCVAASKGIGAVMSGIIYLFVCVKAWAGAFPIGSATQYIGAITGVFMGLNGLIVAFENVRANGVFLSNTFEYLDIPNSMYQGSLTTEKRSDRQYEVEFRNVSFKYPGSEAYALKNVNIKFKVGSRLAVVGMNGSGKTTFIKLLCRLYDPTEGEILLNGIDIRKYRYDDYRDIFSIVFQDFQLFAMPLGENVAVSASYDREDVADCLEKAGFSERLSTMPKGLDTVLYKTLDKDGVEVSGGEAQKIAIARAIYKNAPFIILDEPTAALDPVAEAEIYEKFNDIAGDKTAIYISHRLSSCRFCDEILVFDHGQIVQTGSHEELVHQEAGKYYALWNAQAQYYAVNG